MTGGMGAGRTGRALPGHWASGMDAWAGQGLSLGALGLFLARFDSVLFLSHIFGHCSRTRFMNTVHHKIFRKKKIF